jgi:hypothetical protein
MQQKSDRSGVRAGLACKKRMANSGLLRFVQKIAASFAATNAAAILQQKEGLAAVSAIYTERG